jgi:two-component system chemotaxis response regulator CheB
VVPATAPDPVPSTGPIEVVVVGASAGGVEALSRFVSGLPIDLRAAVLVVLHVSASGTSVLPHILARRCSLPVAAPRDGEPLIPGHVYVAPPDSHLVVERARVRLVKGPRENGHRPAIDVTMRSAALTYDGRTAGIVLSGTRDDGTAGLLAIKQHGGYAIVQDPDEALYDGMPRSALDHVEVDAVLSVGDMGRWLVGPVRPAPVGEPVAELVDMADGDEPPGNPTRFTCPDCGGVLYEQTPGSLTRYRCSVGHAFSHESLLTEQERKVEEALWAAIRSLDDRVALLERLAERARANGDYRVAESFVARAQDVRSKAETIRVAVRFELPDASTGKLSPVPSEA